MVRLNAFSALIMLAYSVIALALQNGVYRISGMPGFLLTLKGAGRMCSLTEETINSDTQKVRLDTHSTTCFSLCHVVDCGDESQWIFDNQERWV